ncbi:unnamed protein product [Allacma fusca]|uniref:Uncharacterized protein n=1 Tax=Allacma fusca TaxID=39272 RepID=A0A8J2P837_9HEXA|nr:unnamed protein product [Allacma fusca]
MEELQYSISSLFKDLELLPVSAVELDAMVLHSPQPSPEKVKNFQKLKWRLQEKLAANTLEAESKRQEIRSLWSQLKADPTFCIAFEKFTTGCKPSTLKRLQNQLQLCKEEMHKRRRDMEVSFRLQCEIESLYDACVDRYDALIDGAEKEAKESQEVNNNVSEESFKQPEPCTSRKKELMGFEYGRIPDGMQKILENLEKIYVKRRKEVQLQQTNSSPPIRKMQHIDGATNNYQDMSTSQMLVPVRNQPDVRKSVLCQQLNQYTPLRFPSVENEIEVVDGATRRKPRNMSDVIPSADTRNQLFKPTNLKDIIKTTVKMVEENSILPNCGVSLEKFWGALNSLAKVAKYFLLAVWFACSVFLLFWLFAEDEDITCTDFATCFIPEIKLRHDLPPII